MKQLLLAAFLLCAVRAYSQQAKDDNRYTLPEIDSYVAKSHYNKDGAQSDIESCQIKVLFPGGFGGMPDFDNPKDIAFQKKYGVTFFSQGCLRIGTGENQTEYNEVVFQFLDSKYGPDWRKEIRTGAIGFGNEGCSGN